MAAARALVRSCGSVVGVRACKLAPGLDERLTALRVTPYGGRLAASQQLRRKPLRRTRAHPDGARFRAGYGHPDERAMREELQR